MANGRKTGGRRAGTPNKATSEVKTFLGKVFTRVFADPAFEQLLYERIRTLQIDGKLLTVLLAYYAGKPVQAHEHSGELDVNLARLIAGPLPNEQTDAEDEP